MRLSKISVNTYVEDVSEIRGLVMATHRENFDRWFVEVLDGLCSNEQAGFVLVMTVFPLLERYLKQRAALNGSQSKVAFYKELRTLFPELRDHAQAQKFWEEFRNGLLHQATFNQKQVGTTGLTLQKPKPLTVEGDDFWINAPAFSKYVLQQILSDFSTYTSSGAPPPPTVAQHNTPVGIGMMGSNTMTGTQATGPWQGWPGKGSS
jgi:hypothetical protein